MLARKCFSSVVKHKACFCHIKTIINNRYKYTETNDEFTQTTTSSLGNMSSKYQVFEENGFETILDIYEEKLRYTNLLETEKMQEESPLSGLNLERGKTGVFNIEELVDILRRENSEDIFVAEVPGDIKYVDYICIVTGKSQKHMQAIAQFVRRVYKLKRYKHDVVPKLEGENSTDWMALDLGNIALHIFSKKARETYNLDSLWALGSQFDDECNKKEPVSEMLERHSAYLEGLEPAS